ncbi:MAG: membrane protein [Bacteroidetes bacterium OLB12]|nr:MAG: membrane protein [Bacteroidetes bacterium OLB12]
METQPTPNLSIIERFNQWITESIMVKLFSIGFLILILLIPASWIEDLIRERQNRADEVIREVSDKWSGPQLLSGPVVRIPFIKKEKVKTWHEGKQVEEVIETEHYAYFLPEDYRVKSDITTEVRKRGIFEVVLYKSNISMQAQFEAPDFSTWNVPHEQVNWKEAVLLNGISDLRGIGENPVVKSGAVLPSEPISDIGVAVNQYAQFTSNQAANDASNLRTISGIITPLLWQARPESTMNISVQLSLKGSERLYFVPTGKSTEVTSTSAWSSPSFEGKLLPEHTVNDSGFTATWKVLSFNRPFSQKWVDREQTLSGSEFGVRLLIPADQYQKSTRTAKYGVLIILLAFTTLFLVEITTKTRIHPFQYILIGAALIIYYTLLLSFSEQVGYNGAYVIASIATTALITLYSTTFLKSKPVVLLFSLLMTSFYAFIFIIIQAQDFSLLIGSVGLFLIIGLLMYFSRNIKWYGSRS